MATHSTEVTINQSMVDKVTEVVPPRLAAAIHEIAENREEYRVPTGLEDTSDVKSTDVRAAMYRVSIEKSYYSLLLRENRETIAEELKGRLDGSVSEKQVSRIPESFYRCLALAYIQYTEKTEELGGHDLLMDPQLILRRMVTEWVSIGRFAAPYRAQDINLRIDLPTRWSVWIDLAFYANIDSRDPNWEAFHAILGAIAIESGHRSGVTAIERYWLDKLGSSIDKRYGIMTDPKRWAGWCLRNETDIVSSIAQFLPDPNSKSVLDRLESGVEEHTYNQGIDPEEYIRNRLVWECGMYYKLYCT